MDLDYMKQGMTPFVIVIAFIAGLSGFLFGFDSSLIADVKDQVMLQLGLTDWQWSQVVSSSLLGCVIGIPVSGLVADKISRRTLLKMIAFGFILSTSICALAFDFNTLVAGRFLVGVCVGVGSYAAPLYISEVVQPQRRGSLVLVNGLAITFGQAMAYLIGYFIHDYSLQSWRLLFWIGSIPAVMLLIGMCFVPHPPSWTFKKYGLKATLNTLKKIRPKDFWIGKELLQIQSSQVEKTGSYFLLLKPPILQVLLLGLFLGIFQQLAGINTIMYYGPVIFESAGFLSVKNAILATFLMGVLNFLFTVVTFIYVDTLGRRTLLLVGTMLAALSLFLVGFLFKVTPPSLNYWLLAAFSIYIFGYCISLGSLFWVLISEIYPAKFRGLAMSIATQFQWGANFAVSLSFLSVFETLGQSFTFSLIGCLCFVAFIVIYYFVPETTGVSLEQIEKNVMAGKKLREIGQPLQTVIPSPARDLLLQGKIPHFAQDEDMDGLR